MITGIKGMNDILPAEIEAWHFIEACVREVFHPFGFKEIRVPVVEKTELFCRSIGEDTDIVEKEMYTFADKSGNSLTLRPEGTASVMRSHIEHKLHILNPVDRLYYVGPMFRYERPQKGRYRQFHQIGAEIIGEPSPLADVQLLNMLWRFFARIGINDAVLQINSLGCPGCRPRYRQALVDFIAERLDRLCGDCRRRYQHNPLRVLDCKVEQCRDAVQAAPSVLDFLCPDCGTHFNTVRRLLSNLAIPFEVNNRMVRGLDYYCRTTFEMIASRLGAQNAVAAGGRYDGLIESLGGPTLPGIGFAIGMERLTLMMDTTRIPASRPLLFLAALGEKAVEKAFLLLADFQKQGIGAEMDFSGKSLKSQLRRADKLQTPLVLILGEDELAANQIQVRDMETATQEKVGLESLRTFLASRWPHHFPQA
ncbi:MAG: histidine--tRNA ligase [Deltaproteobacteria bacterium]|nr:histidine--tRNA ligase [Deltaproteobacteria bacterium]